MEAIVAAVLAVLLRVVCGRGRRNPVPQTEQGRSSCFDG
jgi:hypothetical protein